MLTRTQQNHLKRLTKMEYKIFKSMTNRSKLLYNESLYKTRKEWDENNRHIRYEELYHIIKHGPNFRYLPTHVAQQTMRELKSDCASFFELLKKKQRGEYDGVVNFPHFKRNNYFNLIYPSTYFKILDGQVRITLGRGIRKDFDKRYFYTTLPKNLVGQKIREIRIIPRYNTQYFEIEYVYQVREQVSTGDDTLALDLGLNNFVTAVDSSGTSFIIDGKGLKSYNRLHNKLKSKLSERYSRQGIHTGKEMRRLGFKRKNWVNNYLNQVVNCLIKYLERNKIGKIAYGNAPILLKPYLSKFNDKLINQNLNFIPYQSFIKKLESKCERYGIELEEVDEDFTSILCSKCGYQEIKNRINRGVFHCRKCSTELHADVNAAINIGKQVSPEFIKTGSSGCMIQPVRVYC